MPQPPPPISPDSYEAFVEHALENPRAWFEYIQQSIAYSETLQLQTNYLQEQAKEERTASQAIQNYQTQEISTLQDKYINAKANELQALRLSIPTVHTPATSQSPLLQTTESIPVPLNTTSPIASSPPSHTHSHLSERFPDPDKFNGEKSDLRRFTTQMVAKMRANGDRFPEPYNRVAYTINRLSGKASDQVMPYIDDKYSRFPDYTTVLELLEKAFGDPNKADNARRSLVSLRQNNKDFNTFLAEFQRLAVESSYPEAALPIMLEDKLSREMQAMLKFMPPPDMGYLAFIHHLQELDRRNQKFTTPVPKPWIPPVSAPTYATPRQVDRGQLTGDPMDLNTRRSLQPLTETERQRLKETGSCFRCRKPGHMASQCPEFPLSRHLSKNTLRPRAAIDSRSYHSDFGSENGTSLNRVESRDRN